MSEEHDCPDCAAPQLETIAELGRVEACQGDAAVDVEVLCIGDAKYVGLRMAWTADAAEACADIINAGGLVIGGTLFHAAAARQLAACLLNAADYLDAPESVDFGPADVIGDLDA